MGADEFRPSSRHTLFGSIGEVVHPSTPPFTMEPISHLTNVRNGTYPRDGIETVAGSLQPPIYREAWVNGNVKVFSRTPFSALRDAEHGKYAGWQANSK
ncbi:hypothetical protein TNCV_795571 [Trichonephila clavipes]|nr:hypothetical protein TNCV_795571 [Trichonephila clavipes]